MASKDRHWIADTDDEWLTRLAAAHTPPRLLYRYFSLQNEYGPRNVEDAIVRSRLWLSNLDSYNDPFEGRCRFEIRGSASEVRAHVHEIHRWALPEIQAQRQTDALMRGGVESIRSRIGDGLRPRLEEFIRHGIGVVSFASEPTSSLMWSHYGDSHRGACLEFDVSHAMEPPIDLLFPVRYDQTLPMLFVNSPDLRQESFQALLLTKAAHWEYEREWRALHIAGACHYAQLAAHRLRRVILGARITEELRNRVKAWVSARTPPIPIVDARLDRDSFAVRVPDPDEQTDSTVKSGQP